MLKPTQYSTALQKELLNHLFKHSTLSISGTLFSGLLAIYILWNVTPHASLMIWGACFLSISVLRFLHIRQYKRINPTQKLDRWRHFFVLGAGISGLNWGLGYVLLFPTESISHQVFLLLLIGGLSAGSVTTYSAVPAAGQAFMLSSLLPSITRIFMHHDEIHVLMGVSLLIFATIIMISSNWVHSFLKQANRLGLENRNLAENLNTSIHHMDLLQEKLQQQIDAHIHTQHALEEEKSRALVTLASIGDAVITTDMNMDILYINPATELLTGISHDQAIGKNLFEVFRVKTDEERSLVSHLVDECIHDQAPSATYHDFTLVDQQNNHRIVDTNIAPIHTSNQEAQGMVITFRDVSETHQLMQKIIHQAMHDSLTGLLNRHEFENQLQIALESARTRNIEHVLCYIDLDQFKIVNDSCGHQAGDTLLKQLAGLLLPHIRETDKLGRLGGDEFGLLLHHCSMTKAREIVEYLRQVIRDFRFTWEGKSFEIGSSAGLVALTKNTSNINELLSKADLACYAAKDLGRNRIYIYQSDDKELERRQQEIHWASDLVDALKENRFRLYRQQILSMQQGSSDEQYYEILVRLVDREGNLVPPGAFIPAAERFNIMADIDHWIIQHSFHYIAENHDMKISINLSGNSLNTGKLTEIIRQEARQQAIKPEKICFEITETAAIANLGHTIKTIRELKQDGFSFALDDFGSGLSSFAYLKNLPVDYLKIDGSFVRNIASNPIDRAMVSSIHQIADLMGIQTIAEFVENADIMEILRTQGIDFAQGYFIGRPEPIDTPDEARS